MSPSPREYIKHILDEIDYIQSQLEHIDFETFVRDPTLKRSFVRSLEIIGEAAKKVPEDVLIKWPVRHHSRTVVVVVVGLLCSVLWRRMMNGSMRPNTIKSLITFGIMIGITIFTPGLCETRSIL